LCSFGVVDTEIVHNDNPPRVGTRTWRTERSNALVSIASSTVQEAWSPWHGCGGDSAVARRERGAQPYQRVKEAWILRSSTKTTRSCPPGRTQILICSRRAPQKSQRSPRAAATMRTVARLSHQVRLPSPGAGPLPAHGQCSVCLQEGAEDSGSR